MDTEKLTPTLTNKRIIGLIAFSFLVTFATARMIVYLVLGHLFPNLFLTIRGVHIHHFTYGVVILVLVGLYFLLRRPTVESDDFRWLVLIYGVGLGLTFDEFGMWIRLEDGYWVRQSYDAIIIIALILLNIAYYHFIGKILNVLFWKQIKKIYALFKK